MMWVARQSLSSVILQNKTYNDRKKENTTILRKTKRKEKEKQEKIKRDWKHKGNDEHIYYKMSIEAERVKQTEKLRLVALRR